MEFLSQIFLFCGSFASFAAGVGILRFDDYFQRLHAIGKSGTVGVLAIYTGVLLEAGSLDRVIVVLAVLMFMCLASPVNTHLMARSALKVGMPLADSHIVTDADPK